jgi:GDPmannose 4,6-dehydratase
LGWQPHITCEEMCREMVEHDLVEAQRSALLRSNGFSVDLPFD